MELLKRAGILDGLDTCGNLTHVSAKPSHFDERADWYDTYNEEKSIVTNRAVVKVIQKYAPKARRVLDLACGTGSQVFALTQFGYEVTGSDINERMLEIARKKAKKLNLNLNLILGDMRSIQLGKFDIALTIYNVVGYITKSDFHLSMQNIKKNLVNRGLYIFDTYNAEYLHKDGNIGELTIDWTRTDEESTKVRDIQYRVLSEDNILTSYTISYAKKLDSPVKISRRVQTLQIYTASEILDMLCRNGFNLLGQYGIDGSDFNQKKTQRILTVAQKM